MKIYSPGFIGLAAFKKAFCLELILIVAFIVCSLCLGNDDFCLSILKRTEL